MPDVMGTAKGTPLTAHQDEGSVGSVRGKKAKVPETVWTFMLRLEE